MGSAAQMLAEARRSLGTRGRPNIITRDYASRHGEDFLRASWCDMAITYWARRSDNARAVLPGGDRAYTVWHAQDFQKLRAWFDGTAANVDGARPGDIVFFDWGNTNSIGAIDHVGVVEKALGGGRVQTIEGNTGDQCLRRVRGASVIAGYGRPVYGTAPTPSTQEEEEMIFYGTLANGAGAITPISIPGGAAEAIGFIADNGLVKAPPVRLRVAVHDAKGWYSKTLTVDSAKPKAWLPVRDKKTTDGFAIRREDAGGVPVAWDAS